MEPTGAKGESSFFCPQSEELSGFEPGGGDFSLCGLTYEEMAQALFSMLAEFRTQMVDLHSKVKSSSRIFPLPENLVVLKSIVGGASESQMLKGVCMAPSSYYGVLPTDRPLVALAIRTALQGLARCVADSRLSEEKLAGLSWSSFYGLGVWSKYVKRPRWPNVAPAFLVYQTWVL